MSSTHDEMEEDRPRLASGAFADGLGIGAGEEEQLKSGVKPSDGAWEALVKVGKARQSRKDEIDREIPAWSGLNESGLGFWGRVCVVYRRRRRERLAERGAGQGKGRPGVKRGKKRTVIVLVQLAILMGVGFYLAGARSFEDARKIVVFRGGGVADKMQSGLGKTVLGTMADLFAKAGEREKPTDLGLK